MRATCIELHSRGGGRWTLRLRGRLAPGWCGNLATGLSRESVAIDGGRAVAGDGAGWRAELELRSGAAAPDPRELDLERLLEKDTGAGFQTPIALRRSRVTPSAAHGGCLVLDVEGEDRVGFLAALLRRLAYRSLFPRELELETRSGRALDRFWLRGIGGTAPGSSAALALDASLRALVRTPGTGARPPQSPAELRSDASGRE